MNHNGVIIVSYKLKMKDVCIEVLISLLILSTDLHLSCGNHEHPHVEKQGDEGGAYWKALYKDVSHSKAGNTEGLQNILVKGVRNRGKYHTTRQQKGLDKPSRSSILYGKMISESIQNKQRTHKHGPSSPVYDNQMDSIDRATKQVKSKIRKHFNREPREHLRVKPREQIELVEDNQGSEAKEYENPNYEEDAENEDSENSYRNELNNNYVSVLDNYDDEESDSYAYNTLSSDAAKNEYTNVENTLNEGASEQSERLGKEVNDVLGTLTKWDSRINQIVGDGRQPRLESASQYGPTGDTITNKEHDVDLEGNSNSQNIPTGVTSDLTIKEDNDQLDSNAEGSRNDKHEWDGLEQTETNFTDQYDTPQDVNNTGNLQKGISVNKPETQPYLTDSGILQGAKEVRFPVSNISNLENAFNIFGSGKSKAQLDVVNATKQFQNEPPKHNKQQIVVTGEAEEGSGGVTFTRESSHLANRFPSYLDKGRQPNYFRNVNGKGKSSWLSFKNSLWMQHQRNPYGETFGTKVETGSGDGFGHSNSQSTKLNTKALSDLSEERTGNDGKHENFKYVLSTRHPANKPLLDYASFSNGGIRITTPYSKGPVTAPVTDRIKLITQDSLSQGSHMFNQMNSHYGETASNLNNHGFALLGVPLSKESHHRQFNNSVTPNVQPQPPHYPISGEDALNISSHLDKEGFDAVGRPFVVLGGRHSPAQDKNASNSNNNESSVEHDGHHFQLPSLTPLERGGMPVYQDTSRNDQDLYNQRANNRNRNLHDQHKLAAFVSGNSKVEFQPESYEFIPQRNKNIPYEKLDRRNNYPLDKWSLGYQKLLRKLKDLYGQTHDRSPPITSVIKSASLQNAPLMMKDVSRSLLLNTNSGFKSAENGTGEKEMFFKDLKVDVKPGYDWDPAKLTLATNDLTSLPSIGSNDVAFNKTFAPNEEAEPWKNEDGPLQVAKGKPVLHQTVYNSSLLTKQEQVKLGDGNYITQEKSGVRPVNKPVPFENGVLPTSQESTEFGKRRNGSEVQLSRDSQTSHEVLISYFKNETDLRQKLNTQVNGSYQWNAKPISIENQLGQAKKIHSLPLGTQSKGPEYLDVAGIESNGNQSSDQEEMGNDRTKTEDNSLSKYLEEFISLVNPSNKLAFLRANNNQFVTEKQPSESHVNGVTTNELAPENVLEAAAKKENISDLMDRIIKELSPKLLEEFQKLRSRNVTIPLVEKARLDVQDNAENITVNRPEVVNITDVVHLGQSKNVLSNTATASETPERPPKPYRMNLNKDNFAVDNQDEDLNLLYRKELKSLEISLSQDFMSNWIYYQRSLNEIGITPSMLRSGIANLGTPERLVRVFQKTLGGTDLNVLVVGGSISAGGGLEKDRGNVEGVYHKAFTDWWNNTVTPITTSQLKINIVAIGGTDSEYFAYCIKNYMRELPDIVIWELAANDYKRYEGRSFVPAKPLEQLTRIILNLPSHPALIFANFFRGDYYKTTVGQDCPDSEDEGGKTIAQYYKLTSLSWRNVICSPETENTLPVKKLFSSDGYHPSLLGHAQMSTLLISYLKGVFEETISKEMSTLTHQYRENLQDKKLPALPKPIFHNHVTPRPLCWTLLTPDYGQKLRNTLPDLEFIEASGFQFSNISHWPIRRDRLRCLRAVQPGAVLKMVFLVPSLDSAAFISRAGRELAITTHNSYGGMGELWLDDNLDAARMIVEKPGQKRTQVDIITRNLTPGQHTLTVLATQSGFCLSAVAVL